jgi:hypothetical protein
MRYRYDVAPPQIAEDERVYLREAGRVELWHATYNTVLNAIYVRGNDPAATCHEMAVHAANLAHGTL